MRAVLVVLALLLVASPAAAQSSRPLLGALVAYNGAGLADRLSTDYALARNSHAREGNVLMRSRTVRWTVGTAADLCVSTALWNLGRRGGRARKAALWTAIALTGVKASLAVHNTRHAR